MRTAGSKPSRKRRNPSIRVAVVLFSVIALVAAACGSESEETTTTTQAPSGGDATTTTQASGDGTQETTTTMAPEPAEPVSVTIAIPSDLNSLDLGKETFFDEAAILINVFDSLTTRGSDGSVQPGLATDWSVSDDGMSWTISLREGVLFQSGEEMNATDVAYSIERHLNPDFPGNISSISYGDVESVEVIDDYTVKVNLVEPNALFMQGTPLFSPVVQKSIAEQYSMEEFGASAESVQGAGTGPFSVVSWQRDDRLVLEAFDGYWGGAPSIDELVFRPIPDASARTAALLAGEADIIWPLAVEQVAALEGNPNAEARSVVGLTRLRLILNTNVAPLDNLDVRKAVAHAIDVQSIIDNLLLGYAVQNAGYGVSIEVGFNEDLEPYAYDPDLARTLLADGGYPDGFEVDFHVRTNSPKAEEVGQAIAGQLAEVGITANVIALPSADFQALARENAITMGFSTHNGGGQFHVQFGLNVIFACDATSANAGFYCNPAFDEALNEANSLYGSDPAAAVDLYKEAQRICLEDVCQVALYALESLYGVNPALDWEPVPSGSLLMATATKSE